MTVKHTCDARYKNPYGLIARCELTGGHYLVHRGDGYVWKFEDSVKEETVKEQTSPGKAEPVELSTSEKQVGGDHYGSGLQPIDVIDAWKLDFYEGSALKYLARHRKKNGAEDVKKAIQYLELLLERQYSND